MVKTTGIIRKMDELGRVVFPIEARALLGLEEKDSLELLLDEEAGHIIFQKATKRCIRCQSTENLKALNPGFSICEGCIEQLRTKRM